MAENGNSENASMQNRDSSNAELEVDVQQARMRFLNDLMPRLPEVGIESSDVYRQFELEMVIGPAARATSEVELVQCIVAAVEGCVGSAEDIAALSGLVLEVLGITPSTREQKTLVEDTREEEEGESKAE